MKLSLRDVGCREKVCPSIGTMHKHITDILADDDVIIAVHDVLESQENFRQRNWNIILRTSLTKVFHCERGIC